MLPMRHLIHCRMPKLGLEVPAGVLAVAMVLALGACSGTQLLVHAAKRVDHASNGQSGQQPTGMPAGVYKVGKPYQIGGKWYYPKVDYGFGETGIGSWYGEQFHGKKTANGEIYDMNALTAAHRTLPLPSFVRVTNLENGRSLVVKVNDRGPFARNRIIDMSRKGAQLLGFKNQGTAKVRVEILAAESRAIAARMQGGTRVASVVDTPIVVEKLPKAVVSEQRLPPPPGANASRQRPGAASAVGARKVRAGEDRVVSAEGGLSDPTAAAVEQRPVGRANLFVQVGAYANHLNARRVKVKLTGIGPIDLYHALINDRDLYRVRIGPLASVEEADDVLRQLAIEGHPNARAVVED